MEVRKWKYTHPLKKDVEIILSRTSSRRANKVLGRINNGSICPKSVYASLYLRSKTSQRIGRFGRLERMRTIQKNPDIVRRVFAQFSPC